jgi:selenocysteine lyase/cysteine desulfurase
MPTDVARLGDRSLFPDLEARAYLAHAALSPPSLAARRAVIAWMNDMGRRGAGYFPDAVAQRSRLRARFASLVGAAEGDVALTMNTTQGVVDIALCLPWRPGDRVLCFTGDFPANVTPWQRAAALFGLDLTFVDADRFRTDPTRAWEDFDAATADGVRLVAVSAVQFQTGFRMPLRALSDRARARGGELFVDGIQACGAAPLDVNADGVDYLATGSHKWLMGVEGVGFVYAREAAARALRPHVAGWVGHDDAFAFLSKGAGHLRYDRPLREGVAALEQGTFNALGCVALEASMGLVAGLGVEAIHAHANAYLDALEPALVARGFRSLRSAERAGRSCIVSAAPPVGAVAAWAKALAARGVMVSTPDGFLRFAPHWPNALGEVAAVVDAIDDARRELALD